MRRILLAVGPLGIGLPFDASKEGWRIDEMINVTSIFVGVIFLVMIVWMGWAILRHGPRHTAVHDHGERRSSWIWTVATAGLIFVVVDGDLLVLDPDLGQPHLLELRLGGEAAGRGADRDQRPPVGLGRALRRAGRQVQHPGRHRHAERLPVPVDAPVLFQLASTDVIHSFYLPNLRMKQDAVPGTINRMWFQATELGRFRHRLRPALRREPLQDEGHAHVLEPGSLPAVAGRRLRQRGAGVRPQDNEAHWGWDWRAREDEMIAEEQVDPESPRRSSPFTLSRHRSSASTSFASITRSSPSSSSGRGCCSSLFGGTLAMLIRWQWAFPGEPVPVARARSSFATRAARSRPANYNSIFTMHGLIMIFFAITPILIGAFGNYCIPLHDRRAGHGVPAAQHALVLDVPPLAGPGHRLVLRAARRGGRRLDDLRRRSRPTSARPGSGQTLVVAGDLRDRRRRPSWAASTTSPPSSASARRA